VYFWALLAQDRYPWCDVSAPDADRRAFGWACGALDLLTWVCGEAAEGPLSGQRVTGRSALYQLSLEASRGVSGVESARRQGNPLRVDDNKLGDVAVAAGDLAAARTAYQASLDIRVRLAAADPANAQWQQDLRFVRERIDDLPDGSVSQAGSDQSVDQGGSATSGPGSA
jgi:hypothetical protein